MTPATQLSSNENELELNGMLHLFSSFVVVFRIILRPAGGSQACSFRTRFTCCSIARTPDSLMNCLPWSWGSTDHPKSTDFSSLRGPQWQGQPLLQVPLLSLAFALQQGMKILGPCTWLTSVVLRMITFHLSLGLHKDVRLMFPAGDAVATALHAGLPSWSRLLIDLKKTFQWTPETG